MDSAFSFDQSLYGGGFVPQSVDDFARRWVGGHYLLASAALLVLVLVVVWLAVWKVEGFNPTATLRMQTRDGLGESMEDGKSGAVEQAKTGEGSHYDPSAKANQPGSLAWEVLHSDDYNCNKRESVGDDAWGWMSGVAAEPMADRPKTDNEFSQILAGK